MKFSERLLGIILSLVLFAGLVKALELGSRAGLVSIGFVLLVFAVAWFLIEAGILPELIAYLIKRRLPK